MRNKRTPAEREEDERRLQKKREQELVGRNNEQINRIISRLRSL
jgi:hypothetical protein